MLISSPAKAWEEIRLDGDKRKVFTGFVYPMLGLCAFAVFLGALFINGWGGPESFQIAMTKCCVVVVSLFGGYFLAAYIINELDVKLFKLESDVPFVQQFVGYSFVVIFITNIITGLLPSFSLIAFLLQFYTVYVVWEGARVVMEIEEKSRLKYTAVVSAMIIICPLVIEFIFNKLLFFLN